MFNKEIKIGNHTIGNEKPVFVIAEIGVNHNGNVDLAKKMIEAAATSGADCVKFQTFKAGRVATESAPKADYQLKTTNPAQTQIDMLKQLEIPENRYREIIKCCEENGVVFMSTPYNIPDVDFLDALNVSAYKLASLHAVEPFFIQYVAQKGKPIILATGMSDLQELKIGLEGIRKTNNRDLVLLQCTTNYPSKVEDANLNAMLTMKNEFDVLTGYSDHTQNEICCIVAVSLGARVVEKHFTLDRSMPGPDQSNSAEPGEFEKLVKKIRTAELAKGSFIKAPCHAEQKNAIGMRRSIVVSRNIDAGMILTQEMLTFKRPAKGLSPRYMDLLLGKKVKENLKKDTFIQMSHVVEDELS